jgi:hypothetical protein
MSQQELLTIVARKELNAVHAYVHVDPNHNNRIEGNLFCLNAFRFDRIGVDVTVVVAVDGICSS